MYISFSYNTIIIKVQPMGESQSQQLFKKASKVSCLEDCLNPCHMLILELFNLLTKSKHTVYKIK